MLVSLVTTVAAHPQGSPAGDMDMDHLPSGMGNNTSSSNRGRRLYHVDVTEGGEPCVRNKLFDRVVNTTTYEFGCRDIEVCKKVSPRPISMLDRNCAWEWMKDFKMYVYTCFFTRPGPQYTTAWNTDMSNVGRSRLRLSDFFQELSLGAVAGDQQEGHPNILFSRRKFTRSSLFSQTSVFVWFASQYMLSGPKTLVGSGSVRDVWLVEYKGRMVVVKTLRHMDDQRHRDMHTREMLTMDIVSHVGVLPPPAEIRNVFVESLSSTKI